MHNSILKLIIMIRRIN